ncbi:MAG: excinuclease ABC subunit UvrC [Phycisphaeraceae bacterium]|nr:excinuclease ABC subunit UvrC [Phycisphaeraceae bacterium]
MPGNREKLDELLKKARALPKVPGVYLMKDDKGVVLYVGKAAKLPERVSSYFVPSAAHSGGLGPKKLPMLELIDDFDTIECETEWEALLTENRLIKDIHPRFNAALTDDKTFPYLVITVRDDFPGVFITRDPNAPEYRGAKVYGPFTGVYALREAIQLLQRIFKFRTCSLTILDGDPKNSRFRPCLLYPIKQCSAPCGAKINRDDYRADIQRLMRFLDSKRSVMLRELRQEMDEASESQAYEKAAVLRDQINAIEKLDERGSTKDNWQPEAESYYQDPKKGLESLRKTLGLDKPIRCIECIDIAHLQGNETVGSKVCFVDGRPLKNEYRRYKIKGDGLGGTGVSPVMDQQQNHDGQDARPTSNRINDDYASIREVVSRRYSEAGAGNELYPDVIVIDGGLGQLHAAQEAFDQLDVKPPMVISLAKKEELIYVQAKAEPIRLSRNNLGLKLVQAARDEAHRFAQHYHHILRRKRVLGE